MFSEEGIFWLPPGLADILREMYEIKPFRVAFCLETMDEVLNSKLRALRSATRAEVARGSFDFLPHPPVVFSRPLAKRDSRHGNP